MGMATEAVLAVKPKSTSILDVYPKMDSSGVDKEP